MAEFNPDVIAKPKLEPLPEAKNQPEKKPTVQKKAGEEKAAEKKPDVTSDAKKPADKAKADFKAQRERVEMENKRKQDEYDQKVADGKKHVADLNARFADWYYVISDDVYRKIHLSHDEIFKAKEKRKAQAGKKDVHAGGAATPSKDFEKLKSAGPSGK